MNLSLNVSWKLVFLSIDLPVSLCVAYGSLSDKKSWGCREKKWDYDTSVAHISTWGQMTEATLPFDSTGHIWATPVLWHSCRSWLRPRGGSTRRAAVRFRGIPEFPVYFWQQRTEAVFSCTGQIEPGWKTNRGTAESSWSVFKINLCRLEIYSTTKHLTKYLNPRKYVVYPLMEEAQKSGQNYEIFYILKRSQLVMKPSKRWSKTTLHLESKCQPLLA